MRLHAIIGSRDRNGVAATARLTSARGPEADVGLPDLTSFNVDNLTHGVTVVCLQRVIDKPRMIRFTREEVAAKREKLALKPADKTDAAGQMRRRCGSRKRIPASLPAPTEPPVINGPSARSPLSWSVQRSRE
jgi:hypothetical protein